MSFRKASIFLFLLNISLFFLVSSQKMVVVYPAENIINQYCSKNVYYFEFKVRFSEKFDKIIPFEMIIPLPNRLPFKCLIDGPNAKIVCFHSFSNYVWSIVDNTRVELPYSFPNVEGIRWDYDSFLRTIYRYLWRTHGNCGLEFENMDRNRGENLNNQIIADANKENENKIDIIANIEDISGGECHSSQYDYSFEMNVKLTDGELVEQLKNTKSVSKNMKISFLHTIYLPVLLGEKRQKGITSFRKDYEYKYALCKYAADINKDNYNNNEGLVFECHLPVNKYNRFQGPLQIKPFTDNAYITQIDKDGKTTTKMITIQFDIHSSSKVETTDEEITELIKEEEEEKKEEEEKEQDKKTQVNNNETEIKEEESKETKVDEKEAEEKKEEKIKEEEKKPEEKKEEPKAENTSTAEEKPNPSNQDKVKSLELQQEAKTNIRSLQTDKKEPNFLILDSKLNIFICPDKPILTIQNYNDGIGFGGLNSSGSKYLFLLYGYLSNGYDFANDTLTLLDVTKDEIKFYLKVSDNLEEPDNRKKSVRCSIPSTTSINKNELIEVKCIGSRARLGNNNTDLVLNWGLEENNNFENIVIKWPYDLTKKKHIFFYNIEGLSVKKDDYGCFENKYFFYLYVYDLKAEPKISFNLPLIYPKNTFAECKLYNSVTFKCVIDLRLKRLSKGGKVILSNEIRDYLANKEQNVVLYYVNNSTSSSELDFMLPVDEDCGDFILVGALKDIGYTYLQVILIIIGIIVVIILCVFAITFCVVYEITHRNKKGGFYKQTDEKTIPNVSNISAQPPA